MAWRSLTSYLLLTQRDSEESDSSCDSDASLHKSHRFHYGLTTCTWMLIVQCLNLLLITLILWSNLNTPCPAVSPSNDWCKSLRFQLYQALTTTQMMNLMHSIL